MLPTAALSTCSRACGCVPFPPPPGPQARGRLQSKNHALFVHPEQCPLSLFPPTPGNALKVHDRVRAGTTQQKREPRLIHRFWSIDFPHPLKCFAPLPKAFLLEVAHDPGSISAGRAQPPKGRAALLGLAPKIAMSPSLKRTDPSQQGRSPRSAILRLNFAVTLIRLSGASLKSKRKPRAP